MFSTDSELRGRQVRFLKESPGFVLVALSSWQLALVLFLRPYLVAARDLPPRPWSTCRSCSRGRARAYRRRQGASGQGSDTLPPDTPLVWEQRLFLAVPALLVAVGFVVARRLQGAERFRRTIILASLGTVLVLGALSLRLPVKMLGISAGGERIEYLTLWRFVYDFLPGATSIRAVGRIWTVMPPLALVGGLLGLDVALGKLRSGRWRSWVTAAIVAIGVVEQYQAGLPSFDKLTYRADVKSVRTALSGSGCDAAYVVLIRRSR